MPRLATEQAVGWLEQAQQLYLQHGYTTVQDGRADPQAVAQSGRLLVDVVSYPDILQMGEGAFISGHTMAAFTKTICASVA